MLPFSHMKPEIPTTYEPKNHEDAIYRTWEESGFFSPDICIKKGVTDTNAKPFSIVLPPPNVTGTLHLGHAAMLAIEDIMVRYHRMKGDRTLWIPGTDHAAIATQEKVERILWNEEHKTRHDLGREAFLDRVKKFAQDSHDTIVNQCKKMGASLDWSREAYTLDEMRHRTVNTAFKKMYDGGIIYRGSRIVNWDPKFQTTVSDDEVERREEKAPFYYLQYGPFVIGTARPETKFGDKYVVVHPNDNRYKDYADGQKIEDIEWINGKITATVIKDEAIDMNFGTGVMTITPWHDATDFDIAERHHLDKEQIIGYDGKLLDIAGEFSGMDIVEAREKIVEKLNTKNLIVKTDESYLHNIAVNSRGGGIIEPQIKEQWFINVNKEFEQDGKKSTLKSLMQEAVRSGRVNIIPERFQKIYFHWIDNLRDWCVSRQIWFGHRIPVWYCESSKFKNKNSKLECQNPIVSVDAISQCPYCDGSIEQDPDTLDTWFSSGLWTFSTLGWGSNEKKWQQEKIYHPTSVLETGYDILFFWVARMILMSKYLLGEVPFKTVYLHGLVRDEKGRKMSKSLGNVIDPLDMTAKYGTDAVRLSLVIGGTPGNDIRLGEEKIATFRNFTNKLWNIGRYVIQQPAKEETSNVKCQMSKAVSSADHWILFRLDKIVNEVTRLLESYQFSLAGEMLRDFTWNDFADWYVEIHKIEGNNAVLRYVFETLLKLWHPFMPFVTETLWSSLGKEQLLLVTPWPKEGITVDTSEFKAGEFEYSLREPITEIRAVRAARRIPASEKPVFIIRKLEQYDMATPENTRKILEGSKALFLRLAHLKDIRFSEKSGETFPDGAPTITTRHFSGILFSENVSDLKEITREQNRLESERAKIEIFIKNTEARLKNAEFLKKAPKALVENTRKLLAESKQKCETLQTALDKLIKH